MKLQVISGCLHRRVCIEAAKVPSTLTALTNFARSIELTAELIPTSQPMLKKELGAVKVESANQLRTNHDRHINAKGSKPKSHDSAQCGSCGNQLPHRNASCPGKDSECRKCGKRGHFARVCRFTAKSSKDLNGRQSNYKAHQLTVDAQQVQPSTPIEQSKRESDDGMNEKNDTEGKCGEDDNLLTM